MQDYAGAELFLVVSAKASRIFSLWFLTFTLRHSRISMPLGSIRKVLRSMPRTCLPYMFFSFITSNNWQSLSSGSESRSKGNSCLHLKPSCTRTVSRETPKITAFNAVNFSIASRKARPSWVQPGVLSSGKNK